jgi:hypothetical protein
MSFLAYLYLLRESFKKFFNSKKSVETKQVKTKYACEVNNENKEIIRQKCIKAALEIQYISSFTHWPIAKPKRRTKKNSLVYLDVNRSKRAPLEQRNKRSTHSIGVTKRSTLVNKIISVKKIPNH